MCLGSLDASWCLRPAVPALGGRPVPPQLPVLFLRNIPSHSACAVPSCGQCRGSAQAGAATRTLGIVCFKLLLGEMGQECWMKMGKLW